MPKVLESNVIFLNLLVIVHAYCKQITTPEDDLKQCINNLMKISENPNLIIENEDETTPNVLWSLYYTVTDTIFEDDNKELPTNMFICGGPDLDLDYDNSVKKVFFSA